MKSLIKKSSIAATLFFVATLSTLIAAENGGLLVDVQKISLERRESKTGHGIDRTMALRINIQNNSMKELPENMLNYVMVIQRWGLETDSYERSEGQVKMEKLLPSRGVTLNAGEIEIGGHMHGTSDRHVDHIVAWKITITRDGRPLEFVSNPNFDSLNKRAGK